MDNEFIASVSIEELAAYLDGNLGDGDYERLKKILATNYMLSDLVDTSDKLEQLSAFSTDISSLLPHDLSNLNFKYPDIKELNFDEWGDIFSNSDNSISIAEEDNLKNTDNNFSHDNEINNQTSRTMANSILKGNTQYGETSLNIKDPIFIRQPDDHSCALRSQQIVLRDFGIDIPFKDLERLAKENGVYSDDGTYMIDVGKVLDLAGVDMHQVIGSNMYDLTNELAQGHRVIVGVDANELWYNDSLTDKLKNWFDDVTGHQGGNHALIVAGVEVNPKDPSDVRVILTDPGSGDLRIEYPMKQFMDAWKDTNCFMAATDNPAPYQYDPVTGKEVPSNFVIEQHFNDFVAEHSYQLSPDMINIPEGYQPMYSEHLDVVGEDSYEDFKEHYEEFVEQREMFSTESNIDSENEESTNKLEMNEEKRMNGTDDEDDTDGKSDDEEENCIGDDSFEDGEDVDDDSFEDDEDGMDNKSYDDEDAYDDSFEGEEAF